MSDSELDETRERVRALVEEWAACDPDKQVDVDAEVALWLVLPSEQRDVVIKRLPAFVDMRRSAGRGDAARVADLLGIGRTNAYRLFHRMEEVGPVSGLVRHRRPAGKKSPVRDGFGVPWDGWITDILVARPDAAVPTLRKELIRLAQAADGLKDREPPEITALRRRVNRIRPSAGGAVGLIGNDLLLDLIGVSAVVVETDTRISPRSLGLAIVLDMPSGLVLGHAVFDGQPEQSLPLCVGSVSSTLAHLARAGAPIAHSIGNLCISPYLVNKWARWIGSDVPPERQPRVTFVRIAGDKGGIMLLRRLGDRFEGFGITKLKLDRAGQIVAESDPASATYSSLEDAAYAIGVAVSRWNAGRFAALTLIGSRGRTSSVAKADQIAEDLRMALLPVMKGWKPSAQQLRELRGSSSPEG